MNFRQYVNMFIEKEMNESIKGSVPVKGVQGIKIKEPEKTCKRCITGPKYMTYIYKKNSNDKARCSSCDRVFKANELKGFDTTKIRVNESLDNHFADLPDDQRYYKGTKVRIINKEPSDKEKKIWIQKKDGSEVEVEMDELSMSSEDSLDNKKPSTTSTPALGQRGEMTEQ